MGGELMLRRIGLLVLDGVTRAAARLWYARMLQAAPTTPSPRNSPRVRIGAGPADRVLLVGNGVLHGWGVQLREMSVPGQLGRLLSRTTGRAVVVDYVGEERMNAASAVHWLGDADRRGHDLAVVAIGLNDALRLTPLPDWRIQMTALLQHLTAAGGREAPVLLVGLPRVRAFVMADSAMGTTAQRHADQMDAVLRELAAELDGVRFVSAPEERFEPERPLGSPAMYLSWADQLMPALVPALQEVRARRPVAPEPAQTFDWSGTAPALAADGGPTVQRLNDLTESIREQYGVAMVGVNVVDGDQVYSVAGRGGGPRAMPRSLAYCDRTVAQDAPTLIEDAAEDPVFADNPFIDVVGLPFYAGLPLHASDGRPVATLCLLDSRPRHDIDPAELRRAADLAQEELRRFEPGTSSAASHVPVADLSGRSGAEDDGVRMRLLAGCLRPAVRLVLTHYLRRQARPHWDTRAVVPGPDPLRVLMFGAGLAVGYGGDGADDPFPAQVAAAFAEATGRGVLVEIRARPSVALEHSVDLLGAAGAATFDHVVWSPTLEEAARGSARRWTGQLQRIIQEVRASGPGHVRVTLLALPLVDGDHVLQRVGRVLGRAVNGRIRDAAALEGARFLPLPSRAVPDTGTPLFDTDYRTEVSGLLAQHLADLRARARIEPADRATLFTATP